VKTYEFDSLVERALTTLNDEERKVTGFQKVGCQNWDGRTLRAYNVTDGRIVGYYDPTGWLGYTP
jgi:hypothetical protein